MCLWWPCDAFETAVERAGPTALVLTRQALPQQARTAQQQANVRRGGYVLNGSGRVVRLVSMPSTGVFDAQDEAYRESVLPRAVRPRLAVEAGATLSW